MNNPKNKPNFTTLALHAKTMYRLVAFANFGVRHGISICFNFVSKAKAIVVSSLLVVLCYFLILSAMVVSVYASYCAMGCQSHMILQSEQPHHIQSVASISKVMTAMIVVEHADLDDIITINESILAANGSSIYLQVGQVVSIRSLLYGLLLRSGNDAAIALADYIGGGDVGVFVGYMNDKAALVGMKNTYFLNPSGLDDHDDGNVSSPYDMALMMCASLQYPMLQEIMSTKYYRTEFDQVWSNKNRLLSLYPSVVGGKTGFTKKAGRTLVSGAQEEYLIAIATFRMGDDFSFHKSLYEKLFASYKSYTLVKKGSYYYQGWHYLVEQDLIVITKVFDESNAVVVADKKTHTLTVTYQDASIRQSYTIPGRRT